MATAEATANKLEAERKKALGLAIAQIEKQLGKGSIMRMGSDTPKERIAAIPTGAINLDAAIGIGGIPRGRVTEIYGPESSAARRRSVCTSWPTRRRPAGWRPSSTPSTRSITEYAKKLGRGRRQPARLAAGHGRAGAGDLRDPGALRRGGRVVIDSVAALVPKAEIEGEMGDSTWACRRG